MDVVTLALAKGASKKAVEQAVLNPASDISAALADRYVSSYANAPISRMTMLPTLVNNRWQGFAAGNAVCTARGFEYVVYIRAGNSCVIAQRPVGSKAWTVTNLNALLGPQVADGHNFPSVAVDSDGFIHVSANMHNVPLKYVRSTAPDSIAAFAAAAMVGTEENSVTYPYFSGRSSLYFLYRNGSSGDGNTYLNRYDVATKTWTRAAQLFSAASSGTDYSAYAPPVFVDDDGGLHVTMCWRQSGVANTNRDVGYMRSDDQGVTWTDYDGNPVALPVTHATAPTVFTTPATDSGLLNTPAISVDGNGVPHLAFLYYDATGASNVKHVWPNQAGVWQHEFVTFGTYAMPTNVGIIDGGVARPGIVSYKGETYVIWRARKDGKGNMVRAIDVTEPGKPFEFPVSELEAGFLEPAIWDPGALADGVLKFLLTPAAPGGSDGGVNYGGQWGGVFEMQLNRLKYVGALNAGRAKVVPIASFVLPSATVTSATGAAVPGVPPIPINPDWANQTVLVKLKHRLRNAAGAVAGGVGTWHISQYAHTGGNRKERVEVVVNSDVAALGETPWVPLDRSTLTAGGWLELRAAWVPAAGDTTHGTQLTIGEIDIALVQDANGDYI